MSELVRVECPSCGKMLFKAVGSFDIEIVCTSIHCRKDKEHRIKRVAWPLPIVTRKGFNSPSR